MYGSLKPDELAHHQIARHVIEHSEARLEGFAVRTRDGLPIVMEARRESVSGALLRFDENESAYETVSDYESGDLYRWEVLDVQVREKTEEANVLVPRSPNRGSDDHEFGDQWSSALDPVLGFGLAVVSQLAEEAHDAPPSALGETWDFARSFFRMQAAYLLAWSVTERYSALLFGSGQEPGERVQRLESWPTFEGAIQGAGVRTERRVVDSRDPSKSVTIHGDGQKAWTYWYRVRSNLSHRGKGANRDADIVRESLVDLHDVLRLMLKRDVPGIEDQWRKADPSGEVSQWLMRKRFAWVRRRGHGNADGADSGR